MSKRLVVPLNVTNRNVPSCVFKSYDDLVHHCSSISLGTSCPSGCGNGPTGSDQKDLGSTSTPSRRRVC
jgi:hypothetical protein